MTDRYQALRDAIEAAAVNQSLTAPSLMQVRHLWDESTTHCGGDGLEAMQHFAKIVLTRYGSPQSPARVTADPDTIRALLGERDALREALQIALGDVQRGPVPLTREEKIQIMRAALAAGSQP